MESKKKPRAKLLSDSHQGASICLESSTYLSWRQEKLEIKLVNIIDIVAISNTSKRVYRNRIEEKIAVVE